MRAVTRGLAGAALAVLATAAVTGCRVDIGASDAPAPSPSPSYASPQPDVSDSPSTDANDSSTDSQSAPDNSAQSAPDNSTQSAPDNSASTKKPKGSTDNGSNNNSSTDKGNTGNTMPATTGPRIVYFKLVQKPTCPEGEDVVRSPGSPAIIEWKVTGAHAVALSVDNPGRVGAYGTYRQLTERLEFPFSCGGEVNSTETHTYTIYTVSGDGKRKHRTITASAKVIDHGTGTIPPPTS